MSEKQFDLSEIRVDPALQGMKLAPFFSRFIAFLLDWVIIFMVAKNLWVVVVPLILFLMVKHRGKLPFITTMLELLEERLNQGKYDRLFKIKVIRYAKLYAHFWVFALFAVSMLVAVGLFVGALYMTKAGFVDSHAADENLFLQYLENLYNVFALLGGTAGAIFYFSGFTWKWKGQTPAKRLLGIRVVKLNGEPLTLWNSFERVSGYASSASLFFMGFLQYYWDRNHQTTHDKICETIVVKSRKLKEEDGVEGKELELES